jgi:hypothetical protein
VYVRRIGAGATTAANRRQRSNRASQPAPSSVLTEITRDLPGFSPATQLIDLVVLHHRSAMDGVLKPFQFRLQMLHACLERLHSVLPIQVR